MRWNYVTCLNSWLAIADLRDIDLSYLINEELRYA